MNDWVFCEQSQIPAFKVVGQFGFPLKVTEKGPEPHFVAQFMVIWGEVTGPVFVSVQENVEALLVLTQELGRDNWQPVFVKPVTPEAKIA